MASAMIASETERVVAVLQSVGTTNCGDDTGVGGILPRCGHNLAILEPQSGFGSGIRADDPAGPHTLACPAPRSGPQTRS